jgi:hypothetical protein
MRLCKAHIRPIFALAVASGLLFAPGCQWLAPKGNAEAVDVKNSDRQTLESEYLKMRERARELEARRADTDLDLTKYNAEIEAQKELNRLLRRELEATTADLDYLESQFINPSNRSTREETRASAVAAIADVQLLYDKARGQSADSTTDILQDVESRLAAADYQIQRRNYVAAVYYANRAMRTLDESERRRRTVFTEGDTRIISVPTANLREGPGRGNRIIGKLGYGTLMVELAQKDQWIRVRTRDGTEGWVYGSLVH